MDLKTVSKLSEGTHTIFVIFSPNYPQDHVFNRELEKKIFLVPAILEFSAKVVLSRFA
jgi:hypothetical protein